MWTENSGKNPSGFREGSWHSFRANGLPGMRIIPSFLVLFAFSLFLSFRPASGETIRIHGSDYLQDLLVRMLGEKSKMGGKSVQLVMRGSVPAYDAMVDGIPEIALFYDYEGLGETVPGYAWFPLGYQAVYLLVNAANPLSSLRMDQLTGVFGKSEEFDFWQWGDFGLREWQSVAIRGYVVDRREDITVEYIRHRLLSAPHFKAIISEVDSGSRLLDTIRSRENAIGLLGFTPKDFHGIKVLSLSSSHGEPEVFPSPETVHSGDYPLRLRINLAFRIEKKEVLQPVVQAFYASDFAAHLKEAGFIPLPDSVRERIVREWNER